MSFPTLNGFLGFLKWGFPSRRHLLKNIKLLLIDDLDDLEVPPRLWKSLNITMFHEFLTGRWPSPSPVFT